MPQICPVCSNITEGAGPTHQCSVCRKLFHLRFVNLSETEVDYMRDSNTKWRCLTCDSRERTLRGKSQGDQSITMEHFTLLMQQITTIAEEVKSIRDNQAVLVEELAKCRTTPGNHSSVLSEHRNEIDECHAKIAAQDDRQSSLSRHFEKVQQEVNVLGSSSPRGGPQSVISSFNLILNNVPKNSSMEGDNRKASYILRSIGEMCLFKRLEQNVWVGFRIRGQESLSRVLWM